MQRGRIAGDRYEDVTRRAKRRRTNLAVVQRSSRGVGVGLGDGRSVRGLGVKVKGQGSCQWGQNDTQPIN